MWTYVLFRLGVLVVPRLPRGILSVFGRIVGRLAYVANRSAREAVLRNLAVVLPNAHPALRGRLAQRAFVHGVWGYIEILALAGATPQWLRARYTIDGWEHLDAALAQHRGVIMVTCHAGTPSAGGQLIALHGVATTLVVEPLEPNRLHDLVAGLRGVFGVRIITVGHESLREIIAALRRKELVGIVADRDVAGSGRELPFFGVPTRVTTGAATLALRTNAVVLPAFAFRTDLLKGGGRIETPVEMPHTGDAADDVREGTLRILARIETLIREFPDQWAVFSDVWPREESAPGSSTMPQP
jgi:KDO2-lipid IV(A) lauroyltransferase